MPTYLFNNIDGFIFFREKEEELKNEINSLTNNELKNSDDSLLLFLKTKHTIKKIEFEDYYRVDKGEIEVDVRGDDRFWAYHDLGHNPIWKIGRAIEIRLPFLNNRELFSIKPSSFTSVLPRGRISEELIFEFTFFSDIDKPEDTKSKINREVELTKKYADWLNQDIDSFNNRLDNLIQNGLKIRRDKLSKDDQFFKDLEIPSKQQESVLGFVKPVNKLNLRILKENKEENIEPSLELETYSEILNYINDLGINLERSSIRLRELDEEPLRDIILSALNSVYKGLASGEAFNKEGKTDIIINHLSKILFIAECKIWRGDKEFLEGIGQLLGYLTWRDTKTSYIVFSKNKKISEVIKKSQELIKSHKNFISEIEELSESSIKYKFKQKVDNSKECFVTLHVFDMG